MRLTPINDYEIMINYFNSHNWEKFRTYANTISYQLRTDNDYQIRKVFNNLMKLGFIEKINITKKYVYRYYNPEVDMHPKEFVITFD